METILSSVISKETFYVDVDPFKDKDELFDTCAIWLEKAHIIYDSLQFKNALYQRESIGSTYLGNYIALPHAKGVDIKKPSVLFCRTKSPFLYCSDDEAGEVKYVFMLIIPKETSNDSYIRVLASIATLLTKDEFLCHLDEFQTCEDFISCALKYEEGD